MTTVRLVIFLLMIFCSLFSISAKAADPLITAEPYCMVLHNDTGYTVLGSIGTDYYVAPDGTKGRHVSNFRLAKDEKQQVCSNGPFFEGYKLELVIRTLFPVFSCKTGLGGEVRIYITKKEDGRTNEYHATCL